MIRLGSVIARFSQYVDVWIYTGLYVKGRWQNGDPVKIQLYGSLQENDGKVLKMEKQGALLEETKVFYSKQSLPIDDLQYNNGQNDIRFVIQNKTYRLIKNKMWDQDFSVYLLQLLRAEGSIPPVLDVMIFENGDTMAYENGDTMTYGP